MALRARSYSSVSARFLPRSISSTKFVDTPVQSTGMRRRTPHMPTLGGTDILSVLKSTTQTYFLWEPRIFKSPVLQIGHLRLSGAQLSIQVLRNISGYVQGFRSI